MLSCDSIASLPSGEDFPPRQIFEGRAMLTDERFPDPRSPKGAALLVDGLALSATMCEEAMQLCKAGPEAKIS